ncbi:hypothetical protein DFR68_106362 [Nocardia mexicana]|uniref:Uncharacterized protein n=1 Tax=Nocardia mexicana TaxID=279262 RepID=A0A370H2N3_9NOCA|nr:hypothetical protein DFR68_106362 [Nocardia mexicana]
MNGLDWEVGLLVVTGIPLVVLMIAVLWPQRMPRDRSVRAIRDRIEREGSEGRGGR